MFATKKELLVYVKGLIFVNVGFEILAFPCNQFGAQEPGSNEEIVDFVCTRFKSEFPIFDKVNFKQFNMKRVADNMKSN